MKRRMTALGLVMGLCLSSLTGVTAEELIVGAGVPVEETAEAADYEEEIGLNEAEPAEDEAAIELEYAEAEEEAEEIVADLYAQEDEEAVSEATDFDEDALSSDWLIVDEEEVMTEAAAELDASGTCGANLNWTCANGILKITGTGTTMNNYTASYRPSWDVLAEDVVTVDLTGAANLTHIGSYAFQNFTKMTTVRFPANAAEYSIGDYAFKDCSALTKAALPIRHNTKEIGLTQIGNGVFYGCKSLTSVTMPQCVAQIGDKAFYNCAKLTSIKLSTGLTAFGSEAFYGCGLTAIAIPENVTALSSGLFKNCKSLKTVTYNKKVTSIGDSAFFGCKALTAMTLPDTITSIGKSAFENCSALTSIALGSNIASIGAQAFQMCLALKSITLPSKITVVEERAFYYCTSMTTARLGAGLTTIKKQAFASCEALSTVELPKTVTTIEADAFADCSTLSASGTVRYTGTSLNKSSLCASMASGNEALKSDAAWVYVVSLSTATITIPAGTISYDGKAKTPTPTVKLDGKTLVKDTDYTVAYKNNTAAGTATLTITGKNNYIDSNSLNFVIAKGANTITAPNYTKVYSVGSQIFSLGASALGSAKLTYTSNKTEVKAAADGKITIGARFVGTAVITVTAAETTNYKATSKTAVIKVKPSKTVISGAVRKSGTKIRVSWSSNFSATGYQIQVSTRKDFSTITRSAKITKQSTTRKTFTGLSKKKTYYVRMRAYKVVDGVEIYSSWSKKKTVSKM